jgi:hypothetical protein
MEGYTLEGQSVSTTPHKHTMAIHYFHVIHPRDGTALLLLFL